MAKSSIINPETFINFKLMIPANKLRQSIPSSSDIELNTQTKVNQVIFLKISEMIIFHFGSNSMVIKTISLNHIPLILNDAPDDHTITFFSRVESTNLSFILGGCGQSDATLVSKIPSFMRNPPVNTLADAPQPLGNGHVGNRNNANGNNSAPVHHNNTNGIRGRGGNSNGMNGRISNGNGGGGGGNGNGAAAAADNGANNRWFTLERIQVHIIDVYPGYVNRHPPIELRTFAYEYDSWQAMSGALYHAWLQIHNEDNNNDDDQLPFEIADVNPYLCVPGCLTGFGRYQGIHFNTINLQVMDWDVAKLLVKDVVVIRPNNPPNRLN